MTTRVYHRGRITDATPEQLNSIGLNNGESSPETSDTYYKRLELFGNDFVGVEVWSQHMADDGVRPMIHSILVVSDPFSWDMVLFPEMLDEVEYLARILPGIRIINDAMN